MLGLAFLFLFNAGVMASDIRLPGFSFLLGDISARGFSADELFEKMDRTSFDLKNSICSNRALIWANDFKIREGLETAKIFMFYTPKAGVAQRSMWWYHVAPVVNERGKLAVLDAGFPAAIQRPTTIEEWLESFSRSLRCKEIHPEDRDLLQLIFKEQVFPKETRHGVFDCYYVIAPFYYWTPGQVAETLLGEDESGETTRPRKPVIDSTELFQACLETRSTKIGYLFQQKRKECRSYVETLSASE